MKKTIIFFIIALATIAYAIDGMYTYDKTGVITNPGQTYSLQGRWESAGTFAAAAAEPTTPDATHRTAAAMAAVSKVVIYTIRPEWNAVELRCSSTTDADTTVFDVFVARGASDHYTRIATLTFTTGTQTAGTGYLFADTLVESNHQWHTTASVVSPTGEYIASYAIDTCGYSRIAFVPTTLTNNAVLEITGY